MKRHDFVFMKNDENPSIEYAIIPFNESTKKIMVFEARQENKDQRLYFKSNDLNCHIAPLKLYLSKTV